MSRPKRLRKVMTPPNFKGYKPYGCNERKGGFIELFYEEYEAIKLADYKLLNHKEASALMGISRATFARIYESARRKIAKAFVESKEIKTAIGNACFDKEWYLCFDCNKKFPKSDIKDIEVCPECNSPEVSYLNQ